MMELGFYSCYTCYNHFRKRMTILTMENTHTFREISQIQNSELWSEINTIVDSKIDEFQHIVDDNTLILFTGAGSSAYLGQVLASIDFKHAPFECQAVPTTEIVLYPEKYLVSKKNIILFSFARSGNSPESKAVISLAEQLNPEIKHVYITNNKDGFLAGHDTDAIKIVLPDVTNDQSLAMTSSYTSMLVSAARLLGESLSESFIEALPKYFNEIYDFAKDISALEFNKLFFVGSGIHSATANETSLKMNELTMGEVNVYHESTLAFRHGPKASLTPGSLFVQLLSNDAYVNKYEEDLGEEVNVNDHYHKVVLLPENAHVDMSKYEGYTTFELKGQHSAFELTLLYLWFGQLLACLKSIELGKDPDNPSADGFINRVVKGVTIYDYA